MVVVPTIAHPRFPVGNNAIFYYGVDNHPKKFSMGVRSNITTLRMHSSIFTIYDYIATHRCAGFVCRRNWSWVYSPQIYSAAAEKLGRTHNPKTAPRS